MKQKRGTQGVFQSCPLAAFLYVPGFETDTLAHRKKWGRETRGDLKVNEVEGFKGGNRKKKDEIAQKSKLKEMQIMKMNQQARW